MDEFGSDRAAYSDVWDRARGTCPDALFPSPSSFSFCRAADPQSACRMHFGNDDRLPGSRHGRGDRDDQLHDNSAATAGTTPCDAAFTPQENSVSPPPPPFDPNSFMNSGFIQAAEEDRTGSAQVPPGTTRIRIIFRIRGLIFTTAPFMTWMACTVR